MGSAGLWPGPALLSISSSDLRRVAQHALGFTVTADQAPRGCAGEMGLQEPHSIQQGRIPSPAPAGKSPWQECSLGTEGLQGASSAGRAPEELSAAGRGCAISILGVLQIWIRQKPEEPSLASWPGRGLDLETSSGPF